MNTKDKIVIVMKRMKYEITQMASAGLELISIICTKRSKLIILTCFFQLLIIQVIQVVTTR